MTDPIDDIDDVQGHTKKPLLKVIREKCLDCCAGQHCEVRKCHIKECPLWPYRMGKNPYHSRLMTNDQKQNATNNLTKQKESTE